MKQFLQASAVIYVIFMTFAARAQKKDPNLVLAKIQGQKSRNIIFILTEDHRYDYLR